MRGESDNSSIDWWRHDIGADPSDPRELSPEESRQLADEVCNSARDIELEYADRYQHIIDANALYGRSAGFDSVQRREKSKPLRENVFAQYCDTWVSHIGNSMPRPMVVPIDGDSDALERAKLLVSYCDATWQRERLLTIRLEAIRDSGLSGLRLIRPYRPAPGQPVRLERVHPINIVMDDALSCTLPSEIYIRRYVSRWALQKMYPEHAEFIRNAPGVSRTSWLAFKSTLDAIEVWDAWHIPALPPDDPDKPWETDGMHALCMDGKTLFAERWPVPRFPGAFARAIPPTYGYWGNTYYDRMVSIQEELNRMTRMEQEALHTNAIPRIFLSQGSRLLDQHILKDNIGELLRVSGPAPVFATPAALGGDVYQRIDRRRIQMSEGWGISQLAAVQMKPAGVVSEPGFQAYADFQDKRHLPTMQEDAQAQVDLARALIDLERIEYLRNKNHRVPCARGVNGISMLPWPDLDIEEGKAALTVMPAGILPSSFTGKLDRIDLLLRMGLIDPQMAQRMLDAPDMQAARSLATATEDRIMSALDSIISRNKFVEPQPYWDLQLAKSLWARKINRAEADGVSQDRLDKLRDFRVAIFALEKRMAAKNAMPMPAVSTAEGYEPPAQMPLVRGDPNGPVPLPGQAPQLPEPVMPQGAPAAVTAMS